MLLCLSINNLEEREMVICAGDSRKNSQSSELSHFSPKSAVSFLLILAWILFCFAIAMNMKVGCIMFLYTSLLGIFLIGVCM